MKIQFDIKYRPQIESGEYKVETEEGSPARIICWDSPINKERPIIAIVFDDQIEQYKADGHYDNDYETSNYDLFIITPEPELSEDEKIRNEMIFYFQEEIPLCSIQEHADKMKEFVAWLEKQKEQKPAEYEKPLLSKFERAVYDCAWDKVTCKPEGETQEEYAKRWAWHLLLMVRDWADDYIDSKIESAKRKSYDKGKADAEKPAEWSKENEEKIDDIIRIICDTRECSKIAKIGEEKEDNSSFYDKLVLFLKSLRPRPKQEWSDEDHDYYDAIIAKLEVTQNDAMLTDQQMSFLKSVPERFNLQPKQEWGEGTQKALDEISDYLKYRGMEDEADFIKYLCPQPHWKPSEEQMKTLKDVIDRVLLTCRQQVPLEELYKDLQKLL